MLYKLRPIQHPPRPTPRPDRPVQGVPRLPALPAPHEKRVLDFDIENRPLSYRGYDKTSAEVTAIACRFIGEEETHVWLLGVHRVKSMLEEFRLLYDEADMVTGHFIRRHDLPILNAALIENGRPPLASKLTSDTCLDLVRFSELARSQEALGAMLGVEAPKEQMTQTDWREANRLTPDGIRQTMRRVVGDVDQHIQLRAVLLERGLLRPPKMWNPGGFRVAA